PAGTHGRAYGIALRRLLPRTSLERIAAMVVAGPDRAGALDILRRFGDEGTEVLLRLLVAAPTLKERRGYYDALVELRQGEALLVHMLGHSEWYVVRNVAELCGEMGIASAVPELVRQLRHPDDRVRRAVVAALSRIGGAEALEALQRAIADPSPAVRLFAIRSVEGRDARALARPLAAQLEREPDPDMVREILLALGRIGSPDAIQTLIKASQPARRLFGRKPVGIRLAAVEGLRLAGGSVAIGTLQALLADEEREVSEAAQRALAALPRT
ncbi:MAG TPA: HEAT repeat domain-containing protein, partial [Gemmatimonadales bacterium]|nr:HEAT repeat domain-containing protein [Gemmatimonadales bacterium]